MGLGAWTVLAIVGGIWVASAWFTGLAAKRKGRSRAIWTTLTLFPLGPIGGPLWLASFPAVGEPATGAQKLGRGILILLVIGNFFAKALLTTVEEQEQQRIAEKARESLNYEITTVDEHYKKMNVSEITTCLALTKKAEAMTKSAEEQDDGMWLFNTQIEADRFNATRGLIEDLECNQRTYDTRDLDEALDVIAAGNFESLEPLIDSWIKENKPSLGDELTDIANSFNESSGELTIFEDSILLKAYSSDLKVIVELELTNYRSSEITQGDLDQYLSKQLIDYVCNEETLSTSVRKGASYSFEFWGTDKRKIGYVEVYDECQI